ncbi:MAG: serine/threonine protein kinase [Microbacterium sp.]|uniref:serine/threonine-protein kinase n=1 Tax=Microbacterium sp. TaxID=51671 RepID=UPI001D289994|nr:serine/threonine-protein kinase [Microbacterium sp.]MBW8761822.1 serine/threonine protein kinase [Microbacterium sp.]
MHAEDAPPTEALLNGRYRLLDRLGRGGMATVYRAEDAILERTVAIKLIRHDPEVPFAADRVHTEKALLAAVNHPALVTLFDAHLDPGTPQYLVMELVDGPSLARRMTHGPLSSADAAQIGEDLANALEAVHAAGIIHRDVKPSNVLLAPPATASGRWTAKLADFGIACTPETSKVRTGVVLGTAAYMAPEQLRDLPLTPAADIYALGLVLLEALTGRHGYPIGTSLESARVRLTEPPDIPDAVSPGWRQLILWMTQVDPEERPSAEEVAAEIRGFRGGDRSDSSGPSSAAVTEQLPQTRLLRGDTDRRPRRVITALIAGAAAMGLLAAIGAWTSSAADIVTARAVTGVTALRSAPVTTSDSDSSITPVTVTVNDGDPGPSALNDDKKVEHAAETADKKAEHGAEVAEKKTEHASQGNNGKGK